MAYMKRPQENGEKQGDDKDDHIYDGHNHDHDHEHDHDEGPPKPTRPKGKTAGPPTEEDLQKQLTVLEIARNRIEAFGREADLLASAMRDHGRATGTLTAVSVMGRKQPSEILVPIGAGVFIFAKPVFTNKVLMNIGHGITAEYPIDDALEKLTKALKDIEEKEKKVVAELERLEASAEALTREVQAMYEEMQRAKKA